MTCVLVAKITGEINDGFSDVMILNKPSTTWIGSYILRIKKIVKKKETITYKYPCDFSLTPKIDQYYWYVNLFYWFINNCVSHQFSLYVFNCNTTYDIKYILCHFSLIEFLLKLAMKFSIICDRQQILIENFLSVLSRQLCAHCT